jgi:hypothetical protein
LNREREGEREGTPFIFTVLSVRVPDNTHIQPGAHDTEPTGRCPWCKKSTLHIAIELKSSAMKAVIRGCVVRKFINWLYHTSGGWLCCTNEFLRPLGNDSLQSALFNIDFFYANC